MVSDNGNKTVEILIVKPVNLVRTNSEVEQTDANSSSEQHREICGVAKFRFVVRFSQFHATVFGEVQHKNEDSPDV